jgi:ankyrin repeat protein
MTALMFAARSGNMDIVLTLIDAGANVNDEDDVSGRYDC